MSTLAATMYGTLRCGYCWLMGPPIVARDDRRHLINLGVVAIVFALISAPLLGLGLFGIIRGDHSLHVGLVEHALDSGHWPAHFMFPVMVYGLSGLSHDYTQLAQAALFILTACVVAKGCITYAILVRNCPQLPMESVPSTSRLSRESLLLVIALALMLAAPIVQPWRTSRIYIGQVSPNIWHNPTILLCWPLAILLFFAAYDFLRTRRLRSLAVIAVLAALSVLAKPNFFLAFAPAFAVVCLWRLGPSRLWLLSQLAMLPTVAVLYWQMTASFQGADAMRPDRMVAWMPLAAWRVYSKSIPLSLLFSLAFPLAYLVVFRRSLANSMLLVFAWLVTLSALAWMACFAEVSTVDGSVDRDFNFSWGSHLAVYLLFLVTAMDMCNNRLALQAIERHSVSKWQAKLPWWLLGAHTVSGTIWLVRQFAGRGYY